jgi:hypothetical protein
MQDRDEANDRQESAERDGLAMTLCRAVPNLNGRCHLIIFNRHFDRRSSY